jgi:hypothetical protein
MGAWQLGSVAELEAGVPAEADPARAGFRPATGA